MLMDFDRDVSLTNKVFTYKNRRYQAYVDSDFDLVFIESMTPHDAEDILMMVDQLVCSGLANGSSVYVARDSTFIEVTGLELDEEGHYIQLEV